MQSEPLNTRCLLKVQNQKVCTVQVFILLDLIKVGLKVFVLKLLQLNVILTKDLLKLL